MLQKIFVAAVVVVVSVIAVVLLLLIKRFLSHLEKIKQFFFFLTISSVKMLDVFLKDIFQHSYSKALKLKDK